MSVEALWSVAFAANTGLGGAGVVVFETGRVFGGDGAYYYLGTYEVNGEAITSKIEVIHHAGQKSNIFGPVDRVGLVLVCQRQGNEIKGHGEVVGAPHLKMGFVMRRLANLP